MRIPPTRLKGLILSALLCSCMACTGEGLRSEEDTQRPAPLPDGGTVPDAGTAGQDDAEVPAPDSSTSPPKPQPLGLAPSGFRRLSRLQYANAMKTLFGQKAELSDEFEPDFSSIQGFEYLSELSYKKPLSPGAPSSYAQAAESLSAQIFADPTWRTEVVGCKPASAKDPCIEPYLRRIMTVGFGHPPTQAQWDRYQSLFLKSQENSDLWGALGQVTASVIQSPHLLFRVHTGQVQDGGIRRFDDFEVADRLALFLWNSIPDEDLIAVAQKGQLSSPEQVRAQAKKMLGRPEAREGIKAFFVEWLGLEALLSLSKDEDIFPEQTHTLGQSMLTELTHYFDHRIFEEPDDFFELFTSRRVYLNEDMRKIYGKGHFAPMPEGQWEWKEIPENWDRAGLLTSPGLMAIYSTRTRTSPTSRGLFLLERLLCIGIDPAPDDLDTSVTPPEGAETVRQWNTRFGSRAQCAVCHGVMDPPGLVFENFNAIGIHQPEENGIPIDASGEVLGTKVDGALELGKFIRESPQVKQCVVRHLTRYATGGDVDPGDARVVSLLEDFERQGNRFDTFILDLVSSDLFLSVRPPTLAP